MKYIILILIVVFNGLTFAAPKKSLKDDKNPMGYSKELFKELGRIQNKILPTKAAAKNLSDSEFKDLEIRSFKSFVKLAFKSELIKAQIKDYASYAGVKLAKLDNKQIIEDSIKKMDALPIDEKKVLIKEHRVGAYFLNLLLYSISDRAPQEKKTAKKSTKKKSKSK